jgi:hypothetical protein
MGLPIVTQKMYGEGFTRFKVTPFLRDLDFLPQHLMVLVIHYLVTPALSQPFECIKKNSFLFFYFFWNLYL